jgi:uncharacterized protein YabE (DUF348 family)
MIGVMDKQSFKVGEPYRPYFDRFKNHPYAIPVTTFLVLFFLSIAVFIGLNAQTVPPTDTRIIELSVDDTHQSIPTRATTVGEFLDRAEIKLSDNDIVEPAKETPIEDEKFHINIYRARPLTIDDNGNKTFAYSAATTPRSVAQQANITVYPEDNVSFELPENFLQEGVLGEKVVIDRSTPANLNLYGTALALRTHAKTVGDLLKEKNVQLEANDSVQPVAETPLTPQLQVFVLRSGTQIASAEEVIAMPTEVIEDATLSFGVQAVRQKGSPGKRVVTYQLDLQNGVEVGRHKIQEVTAVEPVKEIVARGKAVYIPGDKVGQMNAAGIPASDHAYVDYIISRESGWCPTKTQGQIGVCPAFPPASVPASLGYGLGQATPGTKMASFGADWMANPVTQLKWANSYAKGRYGTWQAAYNYWQSHHNW